MSRFWKKLFGRPPESETEPFTDDNSYSLEWRNRYLEARLTHLSKEITTRGFSLPQRPILPDDLKARTDVLAATVEIFEKAATR
jgi:hypothetical protein